jgi:uncharacterized protein YcbX
MTSRRTWAVATLWRYPVKSMAGEELRASEAGDRGLLGDRAFGLIDGETGKLASAKRPRLWAGLLGFRAAFVEQPRSNHPLPPVSITLPDGIVVRSDDRDLNALLSQAIRRRVSFASSAPDGLLFDEDWPRDTKGEPSERTLRGANGETVVQWNVPSGGVLRGSFFDSSPIHVVTTATLDHLANANARSRFEPRRFRPNIVIATEGAEGFVERSWRERVLAVGPEVRLRVIGPVVRCVMTTLAQADLPHDPAVLRTVAQHNRLPVGDARALPCVGVYAEVLSPGIVSCGDGVTLE